MTNHSEDLYRKSKGFCAPMVSIDGDKWGFRRWDPAGIVTEDGKSRDSSTFHHDSRVVDMVDHGKRKACVLYIDNRRKLIVLYGIMAIMSWWHTVQWRITPCDNYLIHHGPRGFQLPNCQWYGGLLSVAHYRAG